MAKSPLRKISSSFLMIKNNSSALCFWGWSARLIIRRALNRCEAPWRTRNERRLSRREIFVRERYGRAAYSGGFWMSDTVISQKLCFPIVFAMRRKSLGRIFASARLGKNWLKLHRWTAVAILAFVIVHIAAHMAMN